MSDDPYQSQTDQNTSTTWLNDFKQVDVNLHGMSDYAKSMTVIQDNLKNHQSRVTDQLSSLPQDAFGHSAYPEAAYSLKLAMENFGEFASYLGFLSTALYNIGSAAQIIADSYQGTDGWSAASLDAVNFAYGDTSAPRPGGLPSFIKSQTFYDWYFQQLAQQQQQQSGPDGSAHQWKVVSTSTTSDGSQFTTYQDQNGNLRFVNVVYQDGKKITYDDGPNGMTETDESTISYPGGTLTTTTTTKPDGTVSTTTKNVTSSYDPNGDASSTTTMSDGNGNPTSETVETTHKDGSVTTTTYTYDHGKRSETGQITVGAEDPATGTPVDSPAATALQGLQ